MAILRVPVTKGKAFVEIDTDTIPADVYAEAMLQGLKVLVNRGASKITKETYPVAEEMKAAAMTKAEEQVELIKTSKVKLTGQKSSTKASGAVMTEARRLAKNLVKDSIKAAGKKISHYEASEITKAANAILESEQGASIIAQAQANLDERAKVKVNIDVTSLIVESPKLVAAAEEKKTKAKADKPLSAKQAGMTQTRKRPPAGSQAQH